MEKRSLYMIGNSHIDPVWFWDWDEGMQEVKATFSSALDRMREYPEMTFTATSTAFLEWIERTAPGLFAEIRGRVAEGRFRLTGGWFIEPDCILPCGEALVRQGLYGQRYLREKFGEICRTGSNVDSFGHTVTLPQILSKSGMQEYVFMRPRLDTPVFCWESPDGSRVNAVSLPSEYTTWFYESTKEAVEMAAEAAEKAGLHGMPCCYGVGNHGGGPTKKNIESIYRLREEKPELELKFSGYGEFFDSLTEEERAKLPVRREFFDKINTGCYSMDGELKRRNRMAERRLLMTDMMLAMERCLTGSAHADGGKMAELWKILLFNQFHDTLGGTAVKAARDEAVRQLDEVSVRCKRIWAVSMQNIVNSQSTEGEGFPLFLFNPSGERFQGYVEVELNWFCKDDLILKDDLGREVPYQRTYTQAKVRNYNLGGRRAIVFAADLPAGGFRVYRTVIGEPRLACDIRKEPEFPLEINRDNCPQDTPYLLENEYLRAEFSEEGYLCSLRDKEHSWEALAGQVSYPVWTDERDTWGGMQGRSYEDSKERMTAESLELVESGALRKVVRAVYRNGGSRITQLYILYRGARELEIRTRVFWDKEWKMLRISYPLGTPAMSLSGIPSEVASAWQEEGKCRLWQTYAECAYGTYLHTPEDGVEYSMHRFLDVTDGEGRGLCTANDGKYDYVIQDGRLEFPVARAAIFAQGSGKNWYNPGEGYTYADQGEQEFTFFLAPHGGKYTQSQRYRLAALAEKRCLYLADNIHKGEIRQGFTLTDIQPENVKLMAVKEAEDGGGLIFRLLETEGRDCEGELTICGSVYPFQIGHHEILTLRYSASGSHRSVHEVNLLEEE